MPQVLSTTRLSRRYRIPFLALLSQGLAVVLHRLNLVPVKKGSNTSMRS